MDFKGRKIFLVGIIGLVASLILRFFGVIEPGAVVFLAGIVSCMVGIVVGTVNVIRKWCARRRERRPPAVVTEKPTIVITEEEETRTPKTGLVIIGVCVALFIMAVDLTAKERDGGTEFMMISMLGFAVGWVKWIYDFAQTHKSEKKKAAEAEAKRLEEERRAAEQEHYRLITTPVEVKLIGVSTEFKRGGLKGALLGGFLGGGIGAVVGAVTRNGKAVHRQRFAVKYKNGRIGTEEHEVGSRRYHELMGYVKWEDY